MGITCDVVRVATNVATGNQTITGSLGGLTPKAARFIMVAATSDGTAANDAALSVGAATGTSNEWCVGLYSDNGVGTSATMGWYRADKCVEFVDDTNTVIASAEFVSFNANNVIINWTTAPASAWLLTVELFAGSDLSAHAGIFETGNTVDNTVSVVAPGFQADCLFTGAFCALFNPGTNANHEIGLGLAIPGGNQYSFVFNEQDGQGTTKLTSRSEDSGAMVETLAISNSALDWYGEFATNANGFDFHARNAGSNNVEIGYLALAFNSAVSVAVIAHSTPTSTGNDSEAGVGFTPQFVSMLTSHMEAWDTGYTNDLAGVRGTSSIVSSAQYSNSCCAEDNVGTTNTQSLSDDIAVQIPDDDGAAGVTATFVSFDANGWTFNYSAVEASAKLFAALAIGSSATTSTSTTTTTTTSTSSSTSSSSSSTSVTVSTSTSVTVSTSSSSTSQTQSTSTSATVSTSTSVTVSTSSSSTSQTQSTSTSATVSTSTSLTGSSTTVSQTQSTSTSLTVSVSTSSSSTSQTQSSSTSVTVSTSTSVTVSTSSSSTSQTQSTSTSVTVSTSTSVTISVSTSSSSTSQTFSTSTTITVASSSTSQTQSSSTSLTISTSSSLTVSTSTSISTTSISTSTTSLSTSTTTLAAVRFSCTVSVWLEDELPGD